MNTVRKSTREIEQAAIAGIALLIGEFSELFAARVISCDAGALDAIEEDWVDLRRKTEEIFKEMVSELTDAVDERSIIAKKKLNGVIWGSN
jgi:hypothetical protein